MPVRLEWEVSTPPPPFQGGVRGGSVEGQKGDILKTNHTSNQCPVVIPTKNK